MTGEKFVQNFDGKSKRIRTHRTPKYMTGRHTRREWEM